MQNIDEVKRSKRLTPKKFAHLDASRRNVNSIAMGRMPPDFFSRAISRPPNYYYYYYYMLPFEAIRSRKIKFLSKLHLTDNIIF